MKLHVTVPAAAFSEARYAAEVILGEDLRQQFVLEEGAPGEVRITHGDKTLVMPALFFGLADADWLGRTSLPTHPLVQWELPAELAAAIGEPRLPIIYGRPAANGSYLEEREDGLYLGLDVLGTAFFFLSRYEEAVGGAELDRHGRFRAAASVAGREGLIGRPIVNEYAEILWLALLELWPTLERPPRHGRRLVSHDIDRAFLFRDEGLRTLARTMVVDVVKRQSPPDSFGRPFEYMAVKRGLLHRDPYATADWLMDECEAAGIRTTFFLLIDGPRTPMGSDYDERDRDVAAMVRRITKRGHEIGLHAGYWTLGDEPRLQSELQRLQTFAIENGARQEQWGSRQHVLRWRAETSPAAHERAGLAYDTSLAFADTPGFRAGYCHEYPMYDLVGRRKLTVRQRPLIVMDTSFLSRNYLGLVAGSEATAHALALRGKVNRFGGDFVMLWHNTKLMSRQEREMFRDLLR